MAGNGITAEFPTDIDRKLVKQLDFAMLLTWTALAQYCQKAIRRALPKSFTIRNSFVSQGFRVQAATRANPTAYLYGRTEGPFSIEFMVLQITSGTKLPRNENIAYPLNVPHRRVIPEDKRPKQVIQRGQYNSKRAFLVDENDKSSRSIFAHGLVSGIYVRNKSKRPHRKGENKGGLTLLYDFTPKADIPERLPFTDICLDTVGRNVDRAFTDALAQAVRTAR